ncbi:hypothetical protein [Rhodococcus sp. IEGM 1379]|uniref:hypothetical protein n=1 Tax=Rhodococcus sp. IEGM 1379 TaxID=3047086 RepID=UPI0024B854D7|nr:hypothetical protein [Rhodococcus sp. IEGM 1379]MDI9919234.1 hypothetical protein [Rhodococcus sp. IEGM 1379]
MDANSVPGLVFSHESAYASTGFSGSGIDEQEVTSDVQGDRDIGASASQRLQQKSLALQGI